MSHSFTISAFMRKGLQGLPRSKWFIYRCTNCSQNRGRAYDSFAIDQFIHFCLDFCLFVMMSVLWNAYASVTGDLICIYAQFKLNL